MPVLRPNLRSQRTESRSCRAARPGRDHDMGERGLLVHRLQYAQGQPPSARSAHELNPQTEAAKMAAVRPDHVFSTAARSLETLRGPRLLERRAERLVSPRSEPYKTCKIKSPKCFVTCLTLVAHLTFQRATSARVKRRFSQSGDRRAIDPRTAAV